MNDDLKEVKFLIIEVGILLLVVFAIAIGLVIK
jgi:hypothetical protein